MPRTRRELKTFPINIRELQVERIVDLSPGMRRITLTGDQLHAFTTPQGIDVPQLRNEGFDDHVKLIVPGPGQVRAVPPVQVEGHLDWSPNGDRPTAKDYTPRRWDPEAGELDLDFVRHGTGFASRWADRVQPGDTAYVAGPKSSSMLPTGVDWLLVAGDETALPAIGRLVEDLPDGMRAQVFVEVADEHHQLGLADRPGVQVTWLHRNGAAPGTTDLLEQAVRGAQWWEGEVFAWVAGEATTLKPVRAHLKHERGVTADCLEVTGYWRRTEVVADASGAPVETDDQADDGYERLDALLGLTAPSSVRAATSLGILGRLDRGPATVVELAAELDLDEDALRALLRYLRAVQVVAPDPADPGLVGSAPVALGLLGEALTEDDEYLTQLHEDGPGSFLDLLPADLVRLVRTGEPVPRADGRLAGDVLASDGSLASALRTHRGAEAVWSSPSVAAHHDWSTYSRMTALGPGAPETAATLLRENAGLSITLVDLPSVLRTASADVFDDALLERVTLLGRSPHAPLAEPPGDAVLLVHLLDQLPDVDAVHVLGGLASSLAGAVLVVCELVLDVTDEVHDHDAELDLQLRSAFGSGLRTPEALERLFTQAGLVPLAAPGGQDIGWDMRMWLLRPASTEA